MKKVAKFEKVSFDQFMKDLKKCTDAYSDDVEALLKELSLPKRATKGSAGYDFYVFDDVVIQPNETILLPTGVRAKIDEGWVLKLYPRSGLGFKYGLRLENTVGIIDSDYYFSDNEGHIMAKIKNPSPKPISLKKGMAFMQGVFVEYGITYDDEVETVRNGGFGSTSK